MSTRKDAEMPSRDQDPRQSDSKRKEKAILGCCSRPAKNGIFMHEYDSGGLKAKAESVRRHLTSHFEDTETLVQNSRRGISPCACKYIGMPQHVQRRRD